MLRATSGLIFSGGGIGLKSSGVLAQSAVPASVTGTLSETTLATIAIPAGAMGVNGAIRIKSRWTYPNTANVKTLNARINGVLVEQKVEGSGFQITRTDWSGENRGAMNSQIWDRNNSVGGAYEQNATFQTTAIDMSVAQNLTLTGTLANTGETITLEAYTVELLNP